jgi:type I restriction enzyme S subunit
MKIKKSVIRDVCDFVGGAQPPKSVFEYEYRSGLVRFVQTRDYKSDNFITYIPFNTARKFCNKDDIMIGRYGPPIFQILRGIEGAYNVALMKAVPKKNITNDYLYYLLKQEAIFKYVDGLSLRTGGQTGVDLDSLYKYPILLPDLDYQQNVVDVLKSLDRKIDLNNRINQELDAMAKTLYDYWFVQFDFPNAQGKPYKTSGGKMSWSDELKRDIPKDWNQGELKDIANITMGQSPPGESYNEVGEGMIFYQGCTDFGNRFPTVRKYTTQPTRYAGEGDILLSVRAPVGTLNIAKEDCCIGRGLAALNSKDKCMAYLFGVMINLKQIFDRRNVDGTTFGSITKDDLFSLKVVKPTKEILNQFNEILNPVFQKQNKLELENIQLTELRDWLLPMLMNGQVKVEDKKEAKEKFAMAAEPKAEYKKSVK